MKRGVRRSVAILVATILLVVGCGEKTEPVTDPEALGRLSARLEETRDSDGQIELLKQNGHTEETFRRTIEEKMSDPEWATAFSKSYEAEKS